MVFGSAPSPCATKAPLSQVRESGGAPSAAPASCCALSRILPAALTMAASVPGDGAVLNPCPSPKRSVSAGTTFTSSGGTPSASPTSSAYRPSLPSASVVRLSTILPVGCTRRKTALYAPFATPPPPLSFDPLALLVGRQRVVFLQLAEARLRSAQRVRGHSGPVAAGVDAGLPLALTRLHPTPNPAWSAPGSARTRSASRPSCPGPASRSPSPPPPAWPGSWRARPARRTRLPRRPPRAHRGCG